MLILGIDSNSFKLLWLMLLLTNVIMLIPLPLLKLVKGKTPEENGYDTV